MGMERVLVSALVFCTCGMVAAQTETLTVKRNVELRQSPDESSASLAPLAAQTTVTRLAARQGAWIQVRNSAGKTGWIHLFDASATPVASAAASTTTGTLRGLSNFLSGGNRSRNLYTPTATVGIRGLDAEDIASATPNLAALGQAEALRQDSAQARQFAYNAKLEARSVENLPVPPANFSSSTPGQENAQ